MPKIFSVVVAIKLEYQVPARNKRDAQLAVENMEMPNEYVEDSFEIVKIEAV